MDEDVLEVIFLDDDKYTVLDKQLVKFGTTVKYKGEPPVKEPTAQESYIFSGWIGEEKLVAVTENLILVAKYTVDVNKTAKDAMLKASLENAQKTTLNATVEAGKKVDAQQKAIAKDSRSTAEIVSDIQKNGKTEVGQEINKDNIDR